MRLLVVRHGLEHDAARRRNGDAAAAYLHELELDLDERRRYPPEPRWIVAGLVLMLTSAGLVGLGLWKLVELVSRAL